MQFTKRVPTWTIQTNANTQTPNYAGHHVIADFWHGKSLQTEREVRALLRKAAKASNSTALKTSTFRFEPQGITGVILLAESHIAIHTWPEIGYVAVDVFTCGANAKPKEAIEFLKRELQPRKSKIREMKRGYFKKKK